MKKLEAENESLLSRVENLENKYSKCEQQLKTLSDENEKLAQDKEELLKGKILETLDDENKTLSFVENIANSKIKLDKAKFVVSDLQQRLKDAESSLKKIISKKSTFYGASAVLIVASIFSSSLLTIIVSILF